MNYILAIDEGTSSTRAMLFTEQGEFVNKSQYEINQFYPQQGWVEQDPEEIWEKTLSAIYDVTKEIDKKAILACGITNQRETTVIWDKKTGRAVSPALVWLDRRTEEFCQTLTEHTERIQTKTGLMPDPYFSASKLNWLLTNIPKARELVKEERLAFGTIDSFLIWRLTKGKKHVTDITNASRTLLYNIFEQSWDDDLLKLFDIPSSILPQVMDSDSHFGNISAEILGIELPITGVAGDQQAALIGQQCFEEGMVKGTYGTGGFILLNTGKKPVISKNKLLTTIAYRIKGETVFGLEGSFYQAGTTVKWLRDEMKIISSAAETEQLARRLSSNEGMYLIPSFTGLGAPHWLPIKGAVIVGVACTHNRAHFARAALESVCYQTRDILDCMSKDSQMRFTLLSVDGGMANNDWLLQFLASQSGLPVQRVHNIEATAVGAALLAAIGCGAIESLASLKNKTGNKKVFYPSLEVDEMNSNYSGWLQAIERYK